MKYIVKSQAVCPRTGRRIGEPRKETIDAEHNYLFRHCTTVLQVKMKYEAFWNYDEARELVFVQSVTPWIN